MLAEFETIPPRNEPNPPKNRPIKKLLLKKQVNSPSNSIKLPEKTTFTKSSKLFGRNFSLNEGNLEVEKPKMEEY